MKVQHVIYATVVLAIGGAVAAQPAGAQVRNPHRGGAVTPEQQQQRIEEQRHRSDEYSRALDNHIRQAQQQAARLQQARRNAAYQAEQ